jgi:hypothetical protein
VSERRLAKAGRSDDGLAPAALRDRHDPLWSDPVRVQRLAADTGTTVDWAGWGSLASMPAWRRFDRFREAWCLGNGLESKWPGRFDAARARAAGVDVSSSVRDRLVQSAWVDGVPEPSLEDELDADDS